tara:strand:- start:1477 stop:2004 length:528 start_codon:yes stop_codon:yes gene_type:complete
MAKKKKKANWFVRHLKASANRTKLSINPAELVRLGATSVAKPIIKQVGKNKTVKRVVKGTQENIGKAVQALGPSGRAQYARKTAIRGKIKDREAIINSKTATRQQKSVAKAQKAALIRKRDKVTIEDVRAKQKADMTKSAKARHQAWLEKRKKKKNQKNQKNQKSGRYPTLLNIK